MIAQPTVPIPTVFHVIFWVCLVVAVANLIFSKLCLWRAAWHLQECRKIHLEGDVLIASLKQFERDYQTAISSIPIPKESCHASPENEDR